MLTSPCTGGGAMCVGSDTAIQRGDFSEEPWDWGQRFHEQFLRNCRCAPRFPQVPPPLCAVVTRTCSEVGNFGGTLEPRFAISRQILKELPLRAKVPQVPPPLCAAMTRVCSDSGIFGGTLGPRFLISLQILVTAGAQRREKPGQLSRMLSYIDTR